MLDRAPPCIRQESHGRKRLKPANDTADVAVGKLGGLIPPGGIVVRLPSSAQPPQNIPKCKPESKPEPKAASKPKSKADTKAQSKPEVKPESNPQARPPKISAPIPTKVMLPFRPKPPVLEQVVYNGLCKMLDAQTKKPMFIVTCALKIQKNSDKAFLVLSASNKEDRSHDVLDISAPVIRDDCCLICSLVMDARFSYSLQFSNASDAKKFGLYLESLQKAAARTPGVSKQGNQLRKTEISGNLKPPLSSTECVSTQKMRESETKLIDVESPSTTTVQETKTPTIEDAAEMLFDLIEKILPEAAAAGLNVSEDGISDIQETAIESWLRRGFLKSETDDMKSELLELLRILVRIKRKAESQKQAAQPKAVVIQSLKDFESAGAKSTRIKYSVSEIQRLSSSTVATPARLDKSIVTPRRTQAVGGYSPAAAVVAATSKHEAWLSGETAPLRLDATINTPPMSNEKPSGLSKVCPAAVNAVKEGQISPPQSPLIVKGLGTSR